MKKARAIRTQPAVTAGSGSSLHQWETFRKDGVGSPGAVQETSEAGKPAPGAAAAGTPVWKNRQETFAQLGNRIPEARIGDFSGRPASAAERLQRRPFEREFRLCSEARRRRVEKCPARGGITISKGLDTRLENFYAFFSWPAYFLLNRSTRPAVSMIFCFPVMKG